MKKDKLIVPTPNPAKQDLESTTLFQEKLIAKDTEELLLYSSYNEIKTWIKEQIESELPKEEMAYGL